MEKEEIARKLKSYPMGIIVRLNWNRLNGDLERNYIHLGNNIFDGTQCSLIMKILCKNLLARSVKEL